MTLCAYPHLPPRDLDDILSTAARVYRANVALFAGIAAVIVVPQSAVNLLVLALGPSTVGRFPTHTGTTAHDTLSPGIVTDALTGVPASVTLGVVALALSYRYLGRPLTALETYRRMGVSRFVSLVTAAILVGALLTIGTVLATRFIPLFVLWLVFFVRCGFFPQVLAIEDSSVGGSFRRSWVLTRGAFWRVLGYTIATVLVTALAESPLFLLANTALAHEPSWATRAVGAAGDVLIGTLVQPFTFITLVLLYYDLRVRNEGFDSQRMADALGRLSSPEA